MTRPRILMLGDVIAAFMTYSGESSVSFRGPFPSRASVIVASAAARSGRKSTCRQRRRLRDGFAALASAPGP